MKKVVKIGTRGSQLALYQANKVKEQLVHSFPENTFEIETIKTKGDIILDVALSKIGDKGLFTKEIESALLEGKIDLAVHSLKDLPTVLPEGLILGAVLERGEFRDALVHKDGKSLGELDESDVIATSSLRRKAQLLALNPKFKIVDIRGNVNTRLQKMNDGYCTAMVMAAAGLQRLGFHDRISEIVDENIIIPAVSQGIIAIESRSGDSEIGRFIEKINHKQTYTAASAERTFLNVLEGGCQVPVGCYTILDQETFSIQGFISMPDGTSMIRGNLTGHYAEAEKIARSLAVSFFGKGAGKIIEHIRDLNANV